MNPSGQMIDCGAGVLLQRGREMRTRDGVTLVSDHYYAPGGGKAPTLLMRQPYGRDIASTVVYAHPVWFARHGYHVVIQDVRGRGDSEGEFYPFRYEAKDGYDAVQWLAGLPECDGTVGMYGFSYQGLTQLLAAVEQPPALRAIAPAMAAGDLYHGWFYRGGMLNLASAIGWGTQMLRGDAHRSKDEKACALLDQAASQFGQSLVTLPYSRLPHLKPEGLPTYFHDWLTHDQAGAYWAELDISTRYERITVPGLHVLGWHDLYLQGTWDCFEQLRAKAGTAEAREHQYLIAGPWVHIPWDRQVGEVDYGAEARLATDDLLVRWFDHWLKGKGTWETAVKARFFTMGKNQWENFSTWPLPVQSGAFYLHSNGQANSNHGNGTLSLQAPAQSEPRDVVVVDPDVPVGAPGGPFAAAGPFRQNRLSAGNNVLVYRSEPLEKPVQISGTPRVQLWLASSRDACDVVVKLTRTDSQNAIWNLALGAARSECLFPEGPLVPDQVTRWEITLEPTSCVLQAGDRIGLEVAGHAFPQLDRSANRFGIPAREAGPLNWQRVTLQVLHEKEHPSTLTLPLLN